MYSPAGKNLSRLGLVADLQPFVLDREGRRVIADHVTAAQRRKTDIAALAFAGDAVPRPLGDVVEVHPATFGGRAAHADGGARRRIDLVLVMHFENLDIEIVVQRGRDLLGQGKQQVYRQAHVGGVHYDGLFTGGFERFFLCRLHTRGADDMGDPGLGGQRHVIDGRSRQGEFNYRVGGRDDRGGIVGDRDAERAGPGGLSRITSDQVGARDVRGGDDFAAIRVRDLADAGLSHAPAGADDSDLHVGHDGIPVSGNAN